jgi:GT2 family glycosyltransferase
MTIGCVVLTSAGREELLRGALASLRRQEGVELEVVVVGNDCEPVVPEGVRVVATGANLGIPAGRNAGAPSVGGELIFFLDDDAVLRDAGALAHVQAEFAADPALGALQLRVAPSDGGRPLREWVPRLRAGDPGRSGDVTALWEGAVALRRDVFDRVGGWPGDFLFVHEGVDLAWRVLDAGYRVHYAGDIVVLHPTPAPGAVPARHGYSLYFGARNRVWIARRHLPLPLAVLYVASFAARSLPRLRSRRDVGAALRGYRDGLRQPAGPRRTLRARTIWRMTRAGRPPVI